MLKELQPISIKQLLLCIFISVNIIALQFVGPFVAIILTAITAMVTISILAEIIKGREKPEKLQCKD